MVCLEHICMGIVVLAAVLVPEGGQFAHPWRSGVIDTLGSRQRPFGRRRQRCCVWHRSGVADWDDFLQAVVGPRPVLMLVRIGGQAGDDGQSCVGCWVVCCWWCGAIRGDV